MFAFLIMYYITTLRSGDQITKSIDLVAGLMSLTTAKKENV